ncbi:hypothetical protein ACHQM5_016841 [Ranunculus cassubicifolius]
MSATSSLVVHSGAAAECHEAEKARVVSAVDNQDGDGGEGRVEVGQNHGGGRWPRPETLELLKIRSDMDVAFKGSDYKGPLWEAVSRKLGECGYDRTAKKCKEKFENMYKYNKRRKETRAGKPPGRTYRYSSHLEALDIPLPRAASGKAPETATTPTVAVHSSEILSPSTSNSTSSSFLTKKKRKWSTFFENMTEIFLQKQETFQTKLLEKLEQIEHQRMVREEHWRMQEMDRANKEHELLVQEELAAATRHATIIKLLESLTAQPTTVIPPLRVNNALAISNNLELGNGYCRWPKPEVQALITIRSTLEPVYRGNVVKGSLWEEISAEMKKFGYDRSAKRCKEKWENINKYYKKVKESNKARPENSKTCPYFDQLDALYKEKLDKFKAEELMMYMMRRSREEPELVVEEETGIGSVPEEVGNDNLCYWEDEDEYYLDKDGDEVGRGGLVEQASNDLSPITIANYIQNQDENQDGNNVLMSSDQVKNLSTHQGNHVKSLSF